MKKSVLFVGFFLLTLFPVFVYAMGRNNSRFGNDDSRLDFGFFAGANKNQITGIPKMIEPNPEGLFSGYEFEVKDRFGFLGGVFLNFRPHPLFAVQPELGFAMMHGKVSYSDINDFEYDVNFKYNYLTAGIGFKFYPWRNLFLGFTPQVGFNLTANRLFFTSNGEAQFGPDLETQQLMRNVLKGRPNVTLGFGLGYQFWNIFYVSARYNLGLSDVIETFANSYGFVETANLSHSFQVTLGVAIPLR